jgi:transcriptional regulator GlxA family with amidase domain
VHPHQDLDRAWGGAIQLKLERPVAEPSQASTAEPRAWASTRLGEPLTLDDLATRAGMSTRRLREEVELSPGQWLTRQRVELARELLEATDLPVAAVADRAGFGTAAALRHHLRAVLDTSPITYRRTFHAS